LVFFKPFAYIRVEAGRASLPGVERRVAMAFIVRSKGAKFSCDTVVAPTGYYRTRDGRIVRDGTPSPEMGPIQNAHRFATHRSAARVASKLACPIIREYPKQKEKDDGLRDRSSH
jgi:hypothetical protein